MGTGLEYDWGVMRVGWAQEGCRICSGWVQDVRGMGEWLACDG